MLKTILIILVIFVSIRLIWRFFGKQILKWLGMKALQRVQKSFEGNMGADSRTSHTTANPKTKRPRQFKEKKKVGEYVDFEEID